MFSNKKENYSAEYYYKNAEEHKKILIAQWKSFLRMGAFVLAAIIGIIAFSTAWFSINSRVNNSIMSISTSVDEQFILASSGVRSSDEYENYRDDDGKLILADSAPSVYEKYYDDSGVLVEDNITLYTGSAWHIADASSKLYPGAKGYIDFYIIPKVSGEASFSLSFQLTAYGEEEENQKIKLITDEELYKLLDGHILFFQGVAADGSYQDWLHDGKVSVHAVFEEEVPQKVRIYWIWPRRVRNFVYHQISLEGDLFASKSEDYTALLQRVNEKHETFFYNPNGDLPAFGALSDTMSDEVYNTATQFYNHADEWIGSTVRHLYIELKISD